MKNKNIFRGKSIDKLSSPEQLNQYIRLAPPAIWTMLAAIIVLIIGVIIWSICGEIQTKVPASVVCENGEAIIYIEANKIGTLKEDMSVIVAGNTYFVENVEGEPFQIMDETSDYIIYMTGLSRGTFCYKAAIDAPDLDDGIYQAQVVTQSISPISLVLK